MTDKKILNILYIIILVSIVLIVIGLTTELSILMLIGSCCVVISIIILALLFVHIVKTTGQIIEKINIKVEEYLKYDSYNDAIKYLYDIISGTFYHGVINCCYTNIVMIYLTYDKIVECEEVMNTYIDKDFIDNTHYYRMLLFLGQDDIDSAKLSQRALYKINNSDFDIQKANSLKLMQIISTKKQEEHQKIITNFPIVERIIKNNLNK